MSLVRTILEQNTDPTFVDSLINHKAIQKNDELLDLLKHAKGSKFSPEFVDWIYMDFESIIKEALQTTYHSVVIRYLREYTRQQGIVQRNIKTHVFHELDEMVDFFAQYKELNLRASDLQDVARVGFVDGTIVVGSSYVVNDRDNLYFYFSSAKVLERGGKGIKMQYIKKNFSGAHRDGLDSVALYLKEKFPDDTIFEVLGLDPEKIL